MHISNFHIPIPLLEPVIRYTVACDITAQFHGIADLFVIDGFI